MSVVEKWRKRNRGKESVKVLDFPPKSPKNETREKMAEEIERFDFRFHFVS